jgi:hypothetical protein
MNKYGYALPLPSGTDFQSITRMNKYGYALPLPFSIDIQSSS